MVRGAKNQEIIKETCGNENIYIKTNHDESIIELNMHSENENEEYEEDYENMSIEQILNRNKIEIFDNNDTEPLFDQVVINNKYFKLYLAKNKALQNCSLMVLNEVNSKKSIFAELVENIARLNSVDSNCVLRLKGANVFSNKIYFLFDLVVTSYLAKKKQFDNNNNFKFYILFNLIEMLFSLHAENIMLEDLRFSLLLLDNMDELKFMVPFEQFLHFSKSYDNKKEYVEPEYKYDRYTSPEKAQNMGIGIQNDLWLIGCIIIEMFSKNEIWAPYTKDEMIRDLRKSFVPKIHPDIPKHMWAIICECLNPFPETRINSKELLERYSKIMLKLKIPELAKHLEKYNDAEISKLNQTGLDGEDPKAIRKCPLHPRFDAFWFCKRCSEVICDQCKNTIHVEHFKKGCVIDYLELINQARVLIYAYKEKFNKYIQEVNVPMKETYDELLKTNEQKIEYLYNYQKTKIEDQFDYFKKLLDELKIKELEHLTKFKDYIKNTFEKILNNYNNLQNERDEIEKTLYSIEQEFIEFQDLDQIKKEQIMKEVIKNQELLDLKKRNLIKCVANFHKESSLLENLKCYFAIHNDKYKDNKTNDLIKVLEKKIDLIGKKYSENQMETYLKNLINEYEDVSLEASRNYFNSNSRDLFTTIVNTNRLFSYNLDQGKYFINEVEFKDLPINKFPNYSRSLILNGNLLVSGGYDDQTKTTLPYFFLYDKISKSVTRLNDMIYGHSAHSMISIPDNFIIVVSGSGILKCEKYDMENNSWSELPDISIPRQNCSLFYFNKQYLYAFGGAYWDENKKTFVYLESVERLNLGFGNFEGCKQWELVKTHMNNIVNIKKSVMTVLSYSTNKIFLVGGSIAYNLYSDECIQFDFEKNEFSLNENIKLPKSTCFPNKSFMYFNDKAYQFDNDGHVYEFNFKGDTFNMIKENNVVKNKYG